MAKVQKARNSKSKPKANSDKPIRLVYFNLNQTKRGQEEMAKFNTVAKDDDIPKVVSTRKIRLDHLNKIAPMTRTQELVFEQYEEGYNLNLHGIAGTGKTFVSCYLALKEVLSRESIYDKIVIVRSATPVKDLGFLPGTVDEKIDVYQQPYKAIFRELFPAIDSPAEKLYEQKLYQFVPTSFIRGITLHKSIVIFDEASSATYHELDSVITRLGNDCKIIFCGDKSQSDLVKRDDKEGYGKFTEILKRIPEFRHIEFFIDDIVRSEMVKNYIVAKQQLGY